MVSNLRADADGFLISSQRVDLSMERERLQLLRAIRVDIARTAKAVNALARGTGVPVGGNAAPFPRTEAANGPLREAVRRRMRAQANPANAEQQRAVPRREQSEERSQAAQGRQRDASGRFKPASGKGVDEVREAARREREADAERQRDASGRFQSGKSKNSGAEDDGDDTGDKGNRSTEAGKGSVMARMEGMFSKIGSGLSSLVSGNEQLDPSIAATKEVGDLLSPITKPFLAAGKWLFGKKDDGDKIAEAEKKVSVPWYRRIFGELRGINQKSGGARGGALGKIAGGLGGLAGGALGLLGKVPGVGLLGRVLKGGGGMLGKGLGMAGRFGMGALKRLPLIGNLIGSAMSLKTLFDPDASREDKFHAGGSGVGTLIGGAAGSLLGPIGTVVGGIIGDKVGGLVGDWLATVNWEDVGKTMTGAWDKATSAITTGWDWCKEKFGGVFDAIGSTFADAGKWIAEKFKPITDFASAAKDKTVAVASKVKDFAVEKAAPAVNAVKEFADTAAVSGERLLGNLDKGYRHRETFDGIKGGDSLASMGRYTNDEADKIRELKSSGANTSAKLKGGMPQDVRNEIIAQAKAAGLDPQAMLDMAGIESGGNANAISGTGAIGVYQMTGGTATGLGIADRFDMKQNVAGGMKLAQDSAARLTKAGLPVTRDNLYMLHQLGPAAGMEVIKGAASGASTDQLSQKTQAAMGLNVGKGSKTASDYLATNSIALDAKLGKVSTTMPPLLAAKSTAPAAATAAPAIPSAALPLNSNQATPPAPVPLKIASNDTKADAPVIIEAPLTQNIADRGLAHAATGGIGMNLGR